jgi:protein TonB
MCGADCLRAALLSNPLPSYPQKAKARKLQGAVKLRAAIGQKGTVRELDTLSGNPILAQAAIDAVQHWKFRPTLLNNEPVKVVVTIYIVFQLDGYKTAVSNDSTKTGSPH